VAGGGETPRGGKKRIFLLVRKVHTRSAEPLSHVNVPKYEVCVFKNHEGLDEKNGKIVGTIDHDAF
jgi:hypothetical protein